VIVVVVGRREFLGALVKRVEHILQLGKPLIALLLVLIMVWPHRKKLLNLTFVFRLGSGCLDV